MSRESRNKIIIISILAAVLVGLIFVYIFAVAPLLEPEPEVPTPPPYVAPGEGLYNNLMVTVYPQLDKSNITYLEISNKNGTYAFHKYYDNTMEAEDMRIKGHEAIDFDQSLYSMLIAYVYLPVSYQSNIEKNAPMRGVSDEQMRIYGVTEDTCQASYTVGYEDGSGETKYHTVYIGHATYTDETTYYVALKGRNSVYRFHQEGVETCMMAGIEDYLSPLVYRKFKNTQTAMLSIDRFGLGIIRKGTDTPELLVQIEKNHRTLDGTSNMYDLLYQSRGTGKITKTGASAEQVSNAFTALYTTLMGDKVVCLAPTAEDFEKYGLGIDDECYLIEAYFLNLDENGNEIEGGEQDSFAIRMSQLIDGYYYTLSSAYGEGNTMIIRIPQSTLTFLGTDDKAIFEWAGTDISSLFYEYLVRNEDDGQAGIFELAVRIQRKNDKTGAIDYDISHSFSIREDGNGSVTAIQDNGTKYETVDSANQFTDFYTWLIRLPAPSEFNNMTQDEIDALMADDSAIVFQLYARNNDDEIFRYTYYQIGNSLSVMAVTEKGKMDGGYMVWGEPQVNFNVTLSHIDILRTKFQDLISGKDVTLD